MTALDELAFEGRPFDGLAAVAASASPPTAAPGPDTAGSAMLSPTPAGSVGTSPMTNATGAAQSGVARSGAARSGVARSGTPESGLAESGRGPRGNAVLPAVSGAAAARVVANLRGEILAAHLAAMDVQTRWQEQTLAALGEPGAATVAARGDEFPAVTGQGVRGEIAPTARLAHTETPTRGIGARGDGTRGDRELGSPGGLLRVVLERVDMSGVSRLRLSWTGAPAGAAPLAVRGGIGRVELLAGPEPVLVVEGSVVEGGAVADLAAAPAGYRPEGGLEPLATTPVTRLGAAELEQLGAGRAAVVFGSRYDQPAPALPAGPLSEVTELRTGGPASIGVLRARTPAPRDAADVVAAGWHAGSVLAVWLGLHLVVPDAAAAPTGVTTVELPGSVPAGTAELVAEVVAAGLLPRPWLAIDADLRMGDRAVARLRGLTLGLQEPAGTPMGTRGGGLPPARPVRRGVTGELAAVDELALATASLGDLTLALGPEFARYTQRRATRPPAGGLRLVGRVMEVHGTRGDLSGGAVGITEYDSAADAWYYGAAPSPTVPNVILMETSLQSALLLGYHLGPTLVDAASDYCLRNLDGSATLHRDVDLRGRTIHQRSTLLTTTVLTGAVLQGFTYELWLDGEDPEVDAPFYSGQSLFGFFTATALANQTGLDNGASVPNWLDEHSDQEVRMIDAAVGASGPLELLARVEVVDGGGRHGGGYLRAVRPVDPSDWFFTRHFHLDPVMPGSLGIEAVIQALQAYLVDSGAAEGLAEPDFVVPAGVEFTWRYRGQILAGDGEMTLEVHIREVQRSAGRVRVIADASLWRGHEGMAGLRIYELDGIAAEIREKGTPQW